MIWMRYTSVDKEITLHGPHPTKLDHPAAEWRVLSKYLESDILPGRVRPLRYEQCLSSYDLAVTAFQILRDRNRVS
jgi:hypothetical protein